MFAPVPAPIVAVAAASDLNDDLTILRSVVEMALRDQEIDRLDLLDAQSAANRAMWTAARLMEWAKKQGARPVCASLERLLEFSR